MKRSVLGVVLILTCLFGAAADAADKLRVVSTLRGFWDTTLIEFAKDKGIFAAEGFEIDLVYVRTGTDVLQTVIAGGADLGLGTGTAGALAAVYKGAPVVIVAAEFTGASDLFFYAKASSAITSFKDLRGRKLGISHQGSTTQTVASLIASSQKVEINLVVTGGPPTTMSQVMTGQVDAGWSVYPIGADRIASGEIRIIASGNDAPGISNENTRVMIARREFAQKNEALLKRFFKAYGKVLDWAYSTDEAAQKYAGMHKITVEMVKDIVKKGYPRAALEPGRVGTLGVTIEAAVQHKVLPKPLTKQEIADMFKLVSVLHK